MKKVLLVVLCDCCIRYLVCWTRQCIGAFIGDMRPLTLEWNVCPARFGSSLVLPQDVISLLLYLSYFFKLCVFVD